MAGHDKKENGLVLALGGGGARGLAHIGVLQALDEADISVRAVAGTSIGAEIGAFLASGMSIQELIEIATKFDWKQTLQLFLPDLPTGGLVSGKKILDFLQDKLGHANIEDLAIGYVAIATDLETGEEVVLDRGSLTDAVRASISIPGVLAPYNLNGRLLVDGGTTSPVPFDVARERFGGPVLAVGVHSGVRGLDKADMQPERSQVWQKRLRQLLKEPWAGPAETIRVWLEAQLRNRAEVEEDTSRSRWSTTRVLDQALRITQAQIMNLRMCANPPDLLLTPAVSRVGQLEFYRGRELVEAGYAEAHKHLKEITALLK